MFVLRLRPAGAGELKVIYPPAFSSTYVTASNYHGLGFYPHLAFDPSRPLSGSRYENAWMTASGYTLNQRLHVDLGRPIVLGAIDYDNLHHDGYETNIGVKDFILQGSNSASSFNNLNYSVDTGWTNLLSSSFVQHTEGFDGAQIRRINISGAGAHRYYAFKCANNHGNTKYMGMRRITLYEII